MNVASMTAIATGQGLEVGATGGDWFEFGCAGAAGILFREPRV
jgi:hypothetical protein